MNFMIHTLLNLNVWHKLAFVIRVETARNKESNPDDHAYPHIIGSDRYGDIRIIYRGTAGMRDDVDQPP
jgi:hypothetical protein